jgi:hypothetical protein
MAGMRSASEETTIAASYFLRSDMATTSMASATSMPERSASRPGSAAAGG